jgi:hypothetical protein
MLNEISFKLSRHDAKFIPQENEKFTVYEDFISILENLING